MLRAAPEREGQRDSEWAPLHPAPQPRQPPHPSFDPLRSFAFTRMSKSWNHTVESYLFGLAFVSNVHLLSLHVLSWLDGLFIFSV